MKEQTSCNSSIKKCIDDKYFSIAHLYNEEKPMNMHIHDCYEIYYSISGGRQFLIDNKFYDINPGDIFVINEFESHYISKLDKIIHERIVISIYPEFLKSISSKETNLALCFSDRNEQFCHKVSLDKEQQNRFLYFINKITTAEGFGSDMIEYATFLELMTSINKLYISNNSPIQKHTTYQYNEQVEQILKYINQNITDEKINKFLYEFNELS